MKAIIPEFSPESREPLYLQLYNYIKKQILSNEIVYGEKLPSLRNLSETLSLSITTVEQAYAQLAVEGYVESRPCSGYYVSEIFLPDEESELFNTHSEYFLSQKNSAENYDEFNRLNMPHMIYDLSSFNWNRWKKCINKVITDYPENLLFESDPQGEKALRYEISKYIYESRGVKSNLEQIVIAAGTQQITSHLSNILRLNSIENISVESPGYMLVTNIFKDRGFAINPIDVSKDGINIGRLPWNIASAVYVNPSNQFPTGAVMPVAKRYQLLDWAKKNNSYIIEDDYRSEERR